MGITQAQKCQVARGVVMGMDAAGAYLQRRRLAAGMTQENVADQLGVSGKVVSLWERGESVPQGDSLMRLCDLIGADIREVQRLYLGREPDVEPSLDEMERRYAAQLAADDREFFSSLLAPARAFLRRVRRHGPPDA